MRARLKIAAVVVAGAALLAAELAASAKPTVNKPCETGQKHHCLPPAQK